MIGSLLSLFQSVTRITTLVTDTVGGKETTIGRTADEAAEVLKKYRNEIELVKAGGNMVAYFKGYVVEPSIFITKAASNREDINAITESTVNVYAALYLQALKVMTSVNGLELSESISILANKGIDVESQVDPVGLMDLEGMTSLPNISLDLEAKPTIALSSTKKTDININKDDDMIYVNSQIVRTLEVSVTKTTSQNFAYSSTLKDKDGDPSSKGETIDKFVIPIVIKANIHIVDSSTLINSVDHRSGNISFTKRFLQWRVGLISANDLILAGDLIDAYKKGALDKDNFSHKLEQARTRHLGLDNLLNKKIGLNKMVMSYVMTNQELDALEKAMAFNIDKKSDKTDMMNALLALNVTAINEDRETVNVYINGISGHSSSPIKKLVKASKSGSTDGVEMLAAALMSNKSIF